VAITNDVLADADKHYLTVWMRGDADSVPEQIGDRIEINELGWFSLDQLPTPLHLYFQNLLAGVVGRNHQLTCHLQFTQSPNQSLQR
jgi:hypothetical protein